MDDSLPAILQDLAGALDAELMGDAESAAEIDPAVRAAFLAPSPLAAAGIPKPRPPEVPKPRPLETPPPRNPEIPAVQAAAPSASAPAIDCGDCPDLAAIAARIAVCEGCPLSKTRTNTVPGVGRLAPDVMFIGEGPGADEDRQGLPFVGRAGELLTKMIAAMGYAREEVFIANVVKCRPPDNRKPTPQEMAACMPYLRRQVELVRPKTIVALGATAVQGLFNTTQGINSLRGRWMDFHGIPVMPTFHPAYLLRMPVAKRDAWSDLKQVMARLRTANS